MTKASMINLKQFAADIRTKRGSAGLRAAAVEIGTTAPTLSRIEQGNVPDLDTFIRICKWLKKSPEDYSTNKAILRGKVGSQTDTTPKLIEAHLRADQTLPEKTIEAISRLVELAYAAELKIK